MVRIILYFRGYCKNFLTFFPTSFDHKKQWQSTLKKLFLQNLKFFLQFEKKYDIIRMFLAIIGFIGLISVIEKISIVDNEPRP